MPMAPRSTNCTRKQFNRGAWTAEEDRKLAQVIEIYGPKRWNSIAAKAGINRCGNSCRLRWMNYLRPNIKRGNISDQEEDLILRLHKLVGNRWSLIAGRLPGRTDHEIKNYWNSHLSKKTRQNEKQNRGSRMQELVFENSKASEMDSVPRKLEEGELSKRDDESGGSCFISDNLFDFGTTEPLNLKWMSQFHEMDETWFNFV